MTDQPKQLSRAEVEDLARRRGDRAVMQAQQAGQLDELLAGRDPGACPTCGRPNTQETA